MKRVFIGFIFLSFCWLQASISVYGQKLVIYSSTPGGMSYETNNGSALTNAIVDALNNNPKISNKKLITEITNSLKSNKEINQTAYFKDGWKPESSLCGDNTFVLSIGANYNNSPGKVFPLNFSIVDASNLQKAFKKQCNTRSILLIENQVTKYNLFEKLETLGRLAEFEDTLVVFFSGQGLKVDNELYLIPFDYVMPFNLDYRSSVKRDGIAVKDILKISSKAKKIILILDAMFHDLDKLKLQSR